MDMRKFLFNLAKSIDQAGLAEVKAIRILQGRCPECGGDVSPASKDYLCADCAEKEEKKNELL